MPVHRHCLYQERGKCFLYSTALQNRLSEVLWCFRSAQGHMVFCSTGFTSQRCNSGIQSSFSRGACGQVEVNISYGFRSCMVRGDVIRCVCSPGVTIFRKTRKFSMRSNHATASFLSIHAAFPLHISAFSMGTLDRPQSILRSVSK